MVAHDAAPIYQDASLGKNITQIQDLVAFCPTNPQWDRRFGVA